MYIGIGMLVFLAVIALWMVGTYNQLVMLRQSVRESWSAIETELRRRYDLIPNLVETVKGYAGHEKDTLEAVIKARNSAAAVSGAPEAQALANNALTGALTKLMALSEAYPQLKANENFNQLQNALNDTETRISQARRFYNANVRDMNTAVETFPSVLIAGPMGFKPQTYFGIEDPNAFDPVKVSFGNSNAAQEPGGVIKLNSTIEEKRN